MERRFEIMVPPDRASLTIEQKALAVMRAMADGVAKGEAIGVCQDWGFGTATITKPDGAHTHIGSDLGNDEEENFAAFVDGFYELLCNQTGLSWDAAKTAHQHSRES